jgi:thiol-disulfide isomerase/thioredoxin
MGTRRAQAQYGARCMRSPRWCLPLLAVLWLVVGCATLRHLRPPPEDSRLHAISVRDLRSGDDLEQGAALLEDLKGVHRADADLVHGELKVWTRAEVDTQVLVGSLAARGVDAVAGSGQGSYRLPPGFGPTADARIITLKGEDVEDLGAFAVPGKVTIFDFYADWCGPCRALDGHLRQIAAARSDVAIRKLNIVDFNSPLANHFVGGAIPLIVIYNRSGHRLGELRGNDPRRIIIGLRRATVSTD